MEGLSLDNILTGSDIENLFTDQEIQESEPEKPENNSTEDTTTEVNADDLFEGQPESVGSEDISEEKEDTTSNKGNTSPTFYSSIAKAFAEEGIFPNLDEETASKVTNSDELRNLIEDQIKNNLDERQKRIDEALGVGVPPDMIRQYEGTIGYLDSIKDDIISSEDQQGEELRKRLIFQDFINRGYSRERAEREVQKSFNGGTDIDDAKEALKSNKDFFKSKYNEAVSEAKKEQEEFIKERNEQAKKLKDSILSDKKVFGDLDIDKSTRQRIYDSITKPVYKDPQTGEQYSAIQKYEMDNRVDFLKNLGLIFTLTDGFKSLDGLIKGKVRREVKRGFKELENTLNNTARTSDGNLNYASGVSSESFIGKGWTIDA